MDKIKEAKIILNELNEIRKSLPLGMIEESYKLYDLIRYYNILIDDMQKEGN